MPTKAASDDVIDLCSEEESTSNCAPKRRPENQTTSSAAAASQPSKRLREVGRATAAASTTHEQVRTKTDCTKVDTADATRAVTNAIIFLNSDGNENAIVTDEIMDLLRGLDMSSSTATCAGQFSQHSSSTLKHIQQKDKWSCGFRNMQMMLTALLPLLPNDHSYYSGRAEYQAGVVAIPSLLQLQHLLEAAWAAGFDARGAQHYRYRVAGKSSLIGAVEVSSALSYCGVDSTVVQFIRCRESRMLLVPFCAAYFCGHFSCPYCAKGMGAMMRASRELAQELLESVSGPRKGGFGEARRCPALPIYLQWEGHSVTIVGIERNSSGKVENLLVMDPMKSGAALKQGLMQGTIKRMRLPCSRLETRDCQLIVCSTKSINSAEKERLKVVFPLTAANEAVMRTLP